MIRILKNIDPKSAVEIQLFFDRIGKNPVWQMPLWNEQIVGYIPKRYFILYQIDEVIAYCVVLERKVFGRILFGPLYTSDDAGIDILKEITSFYKKKFYAYLSIQPDIDFSSVFSPDHRVHLRGQIKEQDGWVTKVIDLKLDTELIRQGFSKNHLRSVKKAENNGIVVEMTNKEDDFDSFFDVYDAMNQDRGVIPIAKSRNGFVDFCKKITSAQQGFFYKASRCDGVLKGGALLLKEESRVIYQFGATHRNVKMPVMHLIFSRAMNDLKDRGFELFDMGGYAVGNKLDEQTRNINRFKDGFGGTIQLYPGEQELIINRGVWILVNGIKKVI